MSTNLVIETCLDRDEISTDTEEIEKYNQTVIDLGLDQLAIKAEAVPISPMSKTERAVYEVLCPKSYNLKDYKHPIPLRVLEAYKSVKGYLQEVADKQGDSLSFHVWVDEDPDPVLIAKMGYTDKYLIGRWGPELDTYQTLYKRAIERLSIDIEEGISSARQILSVYDKDKTAVARMKLEGKLKPIYW